MVSAHVLRFLGKCCLIILVTTTLCYGQRQTKQKLIAINEKWYEGKVILEDNRQFAGSVSYNYLEGIMHFKSDTDTRTCTARNILGFDFFDDDLGDRRVFKSILLEGEDGVQAPAFFEILKEFEHFAVLSKVSSLETVKRTYPTDPIRSSTPTGWVHKSVQQKETLYIFDDRGIVRPYLRVFHEEGSGKRRMMSNEKFIKKDLLKEYIGKTYPELEDYAKKNELSFKNKDELLAILDHYELILKTRQ